MNERQFKEFELTHRMDIVNLNGKYVDVRSYDRYRINLYTVYGFFVEVWYASFENRITKVQVSNRQLVDLHYSDMIDISSIID
jgi:hypothetical protein